MLSLEWIQECCLHGRYYWSHHADQERQNDGLSIEQIEYVILHGRVLERYADTGRGESCLVVGFTSERRPVHVVVGVRGEVAVIVTTYIPRPPKFVNPYERA